MDGSCSGDWDLGGSRRGTGTEHCSQGIRPGCWSQVNWASLELLGNQRFGVFQATLQDFVATKHFPLQAFLRITSDDIWRDQLQN